MHFEETSFYTKGSYVRLRPNALPRKMLKEEAISCPELFENNMNTTLSPNTTQGLIPKTEEVQSIAGISKSFDDCPLSPEPSISNKEDKGTVVSPRYNCIVYNSPEKLTLRERIKFVEADSRKKLFETRQQSQRKAKQVVELKNIIKELKSKQLLNPDQAEMLNI